MLSQELTKAILQEINALLKNGVLPVSADHLKHLSQGGNILESLIAMKQEGLISGDMITLSADGTPYRMTNIRLTYAGIRALRQ
jgi:hypothetical protein